MIASNPRLGIVGGGQLARMSCQAAIPLGLSLRVLAEHADDSAAVVCADVTLGSHLDPEALDAFAHRCDIVTFDHELVPPEVLVALAAKGHLLRPSPAALLYAQDKLHQRARLAAAGFPVPPFARVANDTELAAFSAGHGWPLVLKAARGGYDGHGVWITASLAEARAVVAAGQGMAFVAEPFLPIDREIAILVARSADGSVEAYPVVETVQQDGMCREILAPAAIEPGIAGAARALALSLAEVVDVVGVMAVELFLLADGELLINELALRPHNSGHYSIEACETSQFENHIRAVLGWPVGSAELRAPAVATVNIVGGASGADPRVMLPGALHLPGIHPHLYGKGARPGRKLGHVTVLGEEIAETRTRARQAAAALTGEVD